MSLMAEAGRPYGYAILNRLKRHQYHSKGGGHRIDGRASSSRRNSLPVVKNAAEPNNFNDWRFTEEITESAAFPAAGAVWRR